MSARRHHKRPQARVQSARRSLARRDWRGQPALAFAAPQGPLAASAPTRPEPAEPAEPAQAPSEERPETSTLAGPSASETLAVLLAWLRTLPIKLWGYLRSRTPEQWAWVAVLLVAALLRFWDLGAKPLHHDESMHAFYSLLFAQDPSSYTYDPLLHGPFQFHAEGLMFALIMAAQNLFHVSSPGNNPWINDATARIVPALFGLGIVALPIGLRRELGRLGALLAALLLAVSPSFVYFSRFLREDIYFNFFMFALVVCAVRFASSRKMVWLALTAASAVLAYATFEGFYLTIAIFVAFLAALVAWELAYPLARRLPAELDVTRERLPQRPQAPGPLARLLPSVAVEHPRLLLGRLIALLALAGVGAGVAAWGLHTMKTLGAFIQTHTKVADAQVAALEQRTVLVLLYVSIALAALVILSLLWQITRENALYEREERLAQSAHDPFDPTDGDSELDEFDAESDERLDESWVDRIDRVVSAPGRALRALRNRADPQTQPFLRLLLGIPWTQWFVAFVVGWMIFAGLYWEFPNVGRSLGQGFVDGIGKGVWQGLYYWLQQQDVARGAQPVYYYFLLIPLYEQLAVVFGLAGVVYSLFRPTRLRMFLVWWFVGSLGLYSWAGEKMPWLVIHILLPLMLLAGVMLALALQRGWAAARELTDALASGARPRLSWRVGGALASAALGVLLLIPMIHSMYLLTYQDPANGPLEMMIYVQTTPDVDTVMAKINQADQKLHGGRHQLSVVVGAGEEWPFYWYLRDYWMQPHPNTYATFDPTSLQTINPDVLILYPTDAQTFMAAHPTGYHEKQYALRSWFDESYKPQLACQTHPGTKCPANVDYAFYGKGLGPWISYGSNPPPNATFNAGRAASRLWNWLWMRQPLGSTTGPYYDFVFIVKDGLPIQP